MTKPRSHLSAEEFVPSGTGCRTFTSSSAKPTLRGSALEEPEEGASRGGHGTTRGLRVPLLVSGSGVRPGVVPEDARLVDAAPTVAALLGARPPNDA